jgi:hypothetical protein
MLQKTFEANPQILKSSNPQIPQIVIPNRNFSNPHPPRRIKSSNKKFNPTKNIRSMQFVSHRLGRWLWCQTLPALLKQKNNNNTNNTNHSINTLFKQNTTYPHFSNFESNISLPLNLLSSIACVKIKDFFSSCIALTEK